MGGGRVAAPPLAVSNAALGGVRLVVGDQSRAPVADHEPHAPRAAFDHAVKGPLPAGGILPHALDDADDLAVTILADADGDQDADVPHASAPGVLVPHAVHEHVWVLVTQRPRAPFVDLGVHALELVAQCPGRHAVAPQQLAGVVDLPGGHAGQVHVDQRLLYAFLASAVAFDHRGPEQGALQFRRLELEPAGLGGQARARSGRPDTPSVRWNARISRRWRISSASASSIALTIRSAFSRTMASSLPSNMARSNRMISLDMAPCLFPITVFHCPAAENRTRHGPCPLPGNPNYKVRKNSGTRGCGHFLGDNHAAIPWL